MEKSKMSTLNGLIWSRCSIAPTCPAKSHSSAHPTEKDGARVRMNVAADHEKDNENTDKRKAEEEKKQPTDFRKASCGPSAVVQSSGPQTFQEVTPI